MDKREKISEMIECKRTSTLNYLIANTIFLVLLIVTLVLVILLLNKINVFIFLLISIILTFISMMISFKYYKKDRVNDKKLDQAINDFFEE